MTYEDDVVLVGRAKVQEARMTRAVCEAAVRIVAHWTTNPAAAIAFPVTTVGVQTVHEAVRRYLDVSWDSDPLECGTEVVALVKISLDGKPGDFDVKLGEVGVITAAVMRHGYRVRFKNSPRDGIIVRDYWVVSKSEFEDKLAEMCGVVDEVGCRVFPTTMDFDVSVADAARALAKQAGLPERGVSPASPEGRLTEVFPRNL